MDIFVQTSNRESDGKYLVRRCKVACYVNSEAVVWEVGGAQQPRQPQQESPSVTPLWHFHPAVADKRKRRPLESTRRLSENDTRHKQTGYTPVASVKSTQATVSDSLSRICNKTTAQQEAPCCSQQWWAFSPCFPFALLHKKTCNIIQIKTLITAGWGA